MNRAESLFARAAEADDPHLAARLRREAAAAAESEATRAAADLESLVRIVDQAGLERVAGAAGRAFGAALRALPPGRRAGVLEAVQGRER